MLLLAGCSKKLSTGGGAMETLFYDVLKMDRGSAYYYRTLQEAHDPKNFSYRHGDDPFVADKCVDAIVRLGGATYTRIEGEAQVILLLSDVLLEDRSALARAQAAGSLARLGAGLVPPPGRAVPDRGDRLFALLKQLDGLHDPATGKRRLDTPETKAAVSHGIEELGLLEFDVNDLLTNKNSLKFFPASRYVVGETDPALREVIDRAIVRRAKAVVTASLVGAISDPNTWVRIDVVNGLRDLRETAALDAVLGQVGAESQPWVRAAMAEYLGAVGGPRAAEALVGLTSDADGTVRHRARTALTALAGRDYGPDASAWDGWLRSRFPASAAAAPAPAGGDAEAGVGADDARRSRARVVGAGPR